MTYLLQLVLIAGGVTLSIFCMFVSLTALAGWLARRGDE